jgi:hypothetical protein
MFLGGADTDVGSAPINGYQQAMAMFERSVGERHLIYVQGAGHEDFHSGDTPPLSAGPDLIGKEATQQIVTAYYLPRLPGHTTSTNRRESRSTEFQRVTHRR